MTSECMDASAAALLPAHGDSLFSATLKQRPEHFHVCEELALEFADNGEHLFVFMEKWSMNTDEVVSLLAECFACQSADIGIAGLKDRHARTRQWFSIRTAQSAELLEHALDLFNSEAENHAALLRSERQNSEQQNSEQNSAASEVYTKRLKLLDCRRHTRKLRHGAHVANHFEITLSQIVRLGLPEADGLEDTHQQQQLQSQVAKRLATIANQGFPNYLGPQRFGSGQRNLIRARQWFRQPRKRVSRKQRSLWISAARSALFNAVCKARVADGCWQQLLSGEPAMLDRSRSFFLAEHHSSDDAMLCERLTQLDIHPSGPWWGRGATEATTACADYEQQVLANHKELCEGLERAGLKQERRALRATAENLSVQWLCNDSLALKFSLLPGVFATSLLNEFGNCCEPQTGTYSERSCSGRSSSER